VTVSVSESSLLVRFLSIYVNLSFFSVLIQSLLELNRIHASEFVRRLAVCFVDGPNTTGNQGTDIYLFCSMAVSLGQSVTLVTKITERLLVSV
jgi:hypothetical protein